MRIAEQITAKPRKLRHHLFGNVCVPPRRDVGRVDPDVGVDQKQSLSAFHHSIQTIPIDDARAMTVSSISSVVFV